MTPDEAPITTLAFFGHPANGVVVRKETEHNWVCLETKRVLGYDDVHKGLTLLWSPDKGDDR